MSEREIRRHESRHGAVAASLGVVVTRGYRPGVPGPRQPSVFYDLCVLQELEADVLGGAEGAAIEQLLQGFDPLPAEYPKEAF